ncbi:two-component system response regulator [Rubrivivax pictus]|uniref:Two-component system response regulator n=1 Tax=Pseudaquabacterium pictum TaxID=2315236 RepID=A0A480AJJ8_9BURK|nr:two-component system response regulator [Rubrivivax pictus]
MLSADSSPHGDTVAATARLLIVDDDEVMRAMATHTLRQAGFDVAEADDGGTALAMLAAGGIDLVLLDLVMPGLDGYEVCRRIRALPQGALLPVLVLTGLNDTVSIDAAYEAGASDFIAKPIHWTLLSHRVRYALRASAAITSAQRTRERLERAQQIAHMGHWELVVANQQFHCSPGLAQVYAAPPEAVATATARSFAGRVCPGDRQRVLSARKAAALGGQPYQMSFEVQRFDGAVRTVFEQVVVLRDASGAPERLEGITQDITDRIEAERRITQLAHFDSLTGLPNGRFFRELCTPALERSARLHRSCALLQLDIDRFKAVNDAVGHAEGDAVLRQVAERLMASIRASDLVVSSRSLRESVVARVGANSFNLLLVDVDQAQAATSVAERVLRTLSAPILLDGRELVLTASLGIALFPRDATDADGLVRCAEQALYSAKAAGRGQHRFFDEAMNQAASARLARESDLRHAIGHGQLRLHYQPKVDAATGATSGVEALVRWQHPVQGLVPPVQFIPLAEECGLIKPLTDWVLEAACHDSRQRLDAGLPLLPVAVNLAAPSFADPGLPDQLLAVLARHQLPPGSLVLEVTESLLMTDVDRAVKRLGALRAQGFAIALDDFGTGYSSLNYLNRFPLDELKIDRSFITDVALGGRHSAIAASVIALGREFGLRVVAEGVETAAQAEALLRLGCRQQQGWLHARPMPAEALVQRLRAEAAAQPPAVTAL